MPEYEIKIADAYDLRILTPEMIALLIEKARNSSKRELHIPVEEILPRGYADYLIRVLEANAEILFGKTFAHGSSVQVVYQLAARQLHQLSIQQQLCFDAVNLYRRQRRTLFQLHTSEVFYRMAKQGICPVPNRTSQSFRKNDTP